jgi:hypothetical protein
MISATGKGLSVLITCDYCPHHSWMTFASWYSFYKMLPDASVTIFCNRTNIEGQMFDWARTLQVPLRLHAPKTKKQQVQLAMQTIKTPLLAVEPDVMLIREFRETTENIKHSNSDKLWFINEWQDNPTQNDWCLDVKDEQLATFISYSQGWGKFVTARWINKSSSPFRYRFGKFGMTSNEMRVEKLWQQLAGLSSIVSRG